MANEITAAIIGFGGMGQRHYQAYQKAKVPVAAIADYDPAKVSSVLPVFPLPLRNYSSQ